MEKKKVTAKWLKETRIAKGFKKQIDFANETGLHHSLISRYEAGGRPDNGNVEKLKKVLDLSPEEQKDFDKWLSGRERMAKKNGNTKKKKTTRKTVRHLNGKSKTVFATLKKVKIPAGKIGVGDANNLAEIIGKLGGNITLKHANNILKMLVENR